MNLIIQRNFVWGGSSKKSIWTNLDQNKGKTEIQSSIALLLNKFRTILAPTD